MVFLTKQLSTEWLPSYTRTPEFEQRKKKKAQTKKRKVREGKQDLLLFDWRVWSIRKWRGRGYLELSSRTQISGAEKRQGGGECRMNDEKGGVFELIGLCFSLHAFTQNMMP